MKCLRGRPIVAAIFTNLFLRNILREERDIHCLLGLLYNNYNEKSIVSSINNNNHDRYYNN